MPNNSAGVSLAEKRRWDLMDTVEERLCITIKEYLDQQTENPDHRIFQACAIDLSSAIVSALMENKVSNDAEIRFAKALTHELQNSLVPGFRPHYAMEEM